MDKYRVIFITVNECDGDGFKETQKKINQWMTTGLLKKYTITASSGGIFLFNILLKKEA